MSQETELEQEAASVEVIVAKYGTKLLKLIAEQGFQWWWENRREIAGTRWRRKEMEARQRLDVNGFKKARKKQEKILSQINKEMP